MKKYLTKKILWRTVCCLLAIALIVCYLPWSNLYTFYPIWLEVNTRNLRDLEEYPDVEIVYIREKPYSFFYECAVYPYLDIELEMKIRDLGYPFNFFRIRYIGTNKKDGWPDSYTSNPMGIE